MSIRRLLPDSLVNELLNLKTVPVSRQRHPLGVRVLELHRQGWAYTELAVALGESAYRVKRMAQQADEAAYERRRSH